MWNYIHNYNMTQVDCLTHVIWLPSSLLPGTYEVWCEGNVFRVSVLLSMGGWVGGGGGGGLSSNVVHQMCHQEGGGTKIEKYSECDGKPKKMH